MLVKSQYLPTPQAVEAGDPAEHLSDSVGIVKRVIKAGRKIFHSILFPENSAVANFLDNNPVVTKIYAGTQVFSFMTFFVAIPKIKKSIVKVIKSSGLPRYDAVMKIITKVGKCIAAAAAVIGGLEAFKLGQQLGEWGLHTAQKVFEVTVGWVEALGVIGTVLSAASIVHSGFQIHEMTRVTNGFRAQPWFHKKGKYDAEDLQQFRTYCKQESKALADQMELDEDGFKKALKCDIGVKDPSVEELQQMHRAVDGMVGRLQLRKRVCIVTIITKIVNIATVACIYIPPLEPLALVLACATGIVKVVTKLFENINQYQLEASLGMIDRPAPKSWSATVLDFAKWEIGGYSKASLGNRVLNSSLLIGNGLSKQISLLGDILVAAGVLVSKFTR